MNKPKTSKKKNESAKQVIIATGRRKKATARVYLRPTGKGRFFINGKRWDVFFTTPVQKNLIMEPLSKSGLEGLADVKAKVEGGGITGQAGAVRLGLARAIVSIKEDLRTLFKREKLLTRDPRAKERKKYGQKGARKSFQWTKR